MRGIVLACIAAVALVTAANAQEWGFVQASANDVRLFYGSPDSDDVTLSLICKPARKSLRIAAFVLPPKAKAGQRFRLTLTAGASSARYKGRVVRDRVHGGIYLEAAAPPDAKIFELLKSSKSLSITVGSKTEIVPLEKLVDAVTKMEKACLGR